MRRTGTEEKGGKVWRVVGSSLTVRQVGGEKI